MIANLYIESAKNIRNEFLKLTKKLDSYQKESAELVVYLEKVSKELQDYSETNVSKIKNKADISTVGEHIIKAIGEIEAEEKKLLRLVKPINDKIDILKKDEEILFTEIKNKYPNISESDIIKEIQSHL